MKCIVIVLVTLLFNKYYCADEGYYWREYFGTIPDDAVPAGKNIDGKNAYIGQAYLKNLGLLVAQINPGKREVNVTYNGSHRCEKYIKILCGPPYKFFWKETNHTHLHLDLNDNLAVLGGHEDKNGYLNIGRIRHSGEVKIGKVNSFWVGSAFFYYNDNGIEKKVTTYEILMYGREGQNLDEKIIEVFGS